MAIRCTRGEKRVSLGDNITLLIVSEMEDYNCWDSVTIEKDGEKKYIGFYFTNNECNDYIEYNSDCVVFWGYDIIDDESYIKDIYDIQSGEMIDGPQEKLNEYYNKNFNVKTKKIK